MTPTLPHPYGPFRLSEENLDDLRFVEANLDPPDATAEWLVYCQTTHSLQLVQIAQLFPFVAGFRPQGFVPTMAFRELVSRGFYN